MALACHCSVVGFGSISFLPAIEAALASYTLAAMSRRLPNDPIFCLITAILVVLGTRWLFVIFTTKTSWEHSESMITRLNVTAIAGFTIVGSGFAIALGRNGIFCPRSWTNYELLAPGLSGREQVV